MSSRGRRSNLATVIPTMGYYARPLRVLRQERVGRLQRRWNGCAAMKSLIACIPALLIACASSGNAPPPSTTSLEKEGTYEYMANLPGQQVRGTMRVVGDTVLVEPVADYCRPAVGAPDPLRIRYTCNGPGQFEQLMLHIDRRNPAQLSRWQATFRVQRQREICVQYAVRDGRQVCVQTQTVMDETTESRSGTLQVRRVSG